MTDTTTQAVTALLDKARAAQADAKDYREANGITQIAPGFMPLMIDTLAALLDNRNTAQANYAATWQAKERLIKERDALLAERDAAELRARESALDAIAAYGQAAEAHEAQLAAEAKLATARGALADLVSWFDGGPSSHGPWIIASGDHGADDAVAVARALAKGDE